MIWEYLCRKLQNMKKTFLLLSALFSAFAGKSQTITQSDLPVVGEVWIEYIDTTGGGISIDPPGTGLNFDFTGLNIHDTDGFIFQSINDAPAYMNASTNFPGSGMCVLNNTDSTGTFFSTSSDGLFLSGFYRPGLISVPQVGLNLDAVYLNPGRLMIPVPFAYPDTRSHTSNFSFSFSPTFPPITVTVSSSFVQYMEADGEGTLTTPFGVFPGVLRFKEITYTVDSTDYSALLTDTVEYSDTTVSYTFVKQGPHAVLASIDLDPNTLSPIRASYYDPLALVGTEEKSLSPVLFPNPATDQISISHVRENTTFEVFDPTGRLLKTIQALGLSKGLIMHTEELSSGMYFLRMSQSGKVYSHQKFQVVR